MAEAEIVTTEKKTAVEKKDKKKKNVKKSSKSDKPGLGTKISTFFKGLFSELKKIVWFGKKQTAKSTGLVVVSLIVVSALISLIDLGFNSVIMWLGSLV